MKKLIKQIICSFIAIVAVIGLTMGKANAQSLLNPNSVIQVTNSNLIPNYSCGEADFDKLYPNPENPNSFYQCAPYGLVLMPCPNGLKFDVETNRCESVKEAVTESGTEKSVTGY